MRFKRIQFISPKSFSLCGTCNISFINNFNFHILHTIMTLIKKMSIQMLKSNKSNTNQIHHPSRIAIKVVINVVFYFSLKKFFPLIHIITNVTTTLITLTHPYTYLPSLFNLRSITKLSFKFFGLLNFLVSYIVI